MELMGENNQSRFQARIPEEDWVRSVYVAVENDKYSLFSLASLY